MGSGQTALYGGAFAGFSLWAWMWIGVAIVGIVVGTWIVVRSRRKSAWVRTPEEIDRLSRKLDGPSSEQIAS